MLETNDEIVLGRHLRDDLADKIHQASRSRQSFNHRIHHPIPVQYVSIERKANTLGKQMGRSYGELGRLQSHAGKRNSLGRMRTA
ncbi:hypothetical protein BGP85_27725 [Pseudomonas putida]|nr:hypothetical protein BGP85_27725 [Pseudomonas putida]